MFSVLNTIIVQTPAVSTSGTSSLDLATRRIRSRVSPADFPNLRRDVTTTAKSRLSSAIPAVRARPTAEVVRSCGHRHLFPSSNSTQLGRDFRAEDLRKRPRRIINYRVWHNRFGGRRRDRRTIRVDGARTRSSHPAILFTIATLVATISFGRSPRPKSADRRPRCAHPCGAPGPNPGRVKSLIGASARLAADFPEVNFD